MISTLSSRRVITHTQCTLTRMGQHTILVSQLRSKVGSTLTKDETLRVNLNIDGAPITSRTHTHLSINLVSIFRCSSSTYNRVYTRSVDSSS